MLVSQANRGAYNPGVADLRLLRLAADVAMNIRNEQSKTMHVPRAHVQD